VNKTTIRSLAVFIGALGTAAYSCSPSAEQPTGLGLSGGTAGTAAKGGASGASGTVAGGTTSGGASSGGTSSGGTVSGGTSSGGTSSGATSSGGTGLLIDTDAQSDGNTMLEDGGECAANTLTATLKTVNMFVVFDRSWSMTECGDGSGFTMGGDPRCTTGPSRWALTSAALKQFFQDPGAADLRVALRFFPDDHPAAGCDGYPTTGGMMGGFMGGMGFGGMPGAAGTTGAAGARPNCDTNACAQPLVDIAPLTADPAPTDTQEQLLLAAIDASPPPDVATLPDNPQTPTSAALAGATQWATTYQAAHPDEKTVIVLITDGEPAGCDTSQAGLTKIVGDAYTNSGVATYAIGLGLKASMGQDPTAIMNAIAMAGGTDMAYSVADNASATADLLAKLEAIRGMAITCAIPVPQTDGSGKKTDPKLVNVTYQSGDNGMPTTFGQVASEADCGTTPAWYYDNNDAPTTITLCPAACTTATGDTMAQLKVALGCKTIVVTK
jgi:hypothetical protein